MAQMLMEVAVVQGQMEAAAGVAGLPMKSGATMTRTMTPCVRVKPRLRFGEYV